MNRLKSILPVSSEIGLVCFNRREGKRGEVAEGKAWAGRPATDRVRLGSFRSARPQLDSDILGQGFHYALGIDITRSGRGVNSRLVVWPGGGARTRARARAASMGGMWPQLSPLARYTGAGPHLRLPRWQPAPENITSGEHGN